MALWTREMTLSKPQFGSAAVQYSITAQRHNMFGAAFAVVVNFGVGGCGQQSVHSVKMVA